MANVNIEYEKNFDTARSKLQKAQQSGLLAACLAVERYTKEYSRYRHGGTRDSYGHELKQDGEQAIGAIGSDEMNAIYEEFGTGEFAEKGDGRKGGWVYYDPVDGQYYFTYGKRPNKPLRRGFTVARSEIIQYIGEAYTTEVGG